jgi:uncharacterized membrane protein YdbT with pleckstrin-like domain
MAYVDKLLADRERIVLRTRQHKLLLLRSIGVALLVVLAALAVAVAVRDNPMAAQAGAGVLIVGALILALLAALPGWLRWANEEYIVTDRRVIQAGGVLTKRVLDSSLDKVNDVRLKQTLLGRMLGYGTLEILTASDSAVNVFDWIPDPLRFKRALLEAKGGVALRPQDRPTEAAPEAALPAPSVAERISQLEDLRRQGLVSQAEYEAKRAELLSRL